MSCIFKSGLTWLGVVGAVGISNSIKFLSIPLPGRGECSGADGCNEISPCFLAGERASLPFWFMCNQSQAHSGKRCLCTTLCAKFSQDMPHMRFHCILGNM